MIDESHIRAALATLIILQAVMLTALFAGVEPHPPAFTPLFGIGPFISAAMSLAAAALMIGSTRAAGRVLAGFAALAALVSFGPQKWFDPSFGLIWPAVLTAQAASVVILLGVVRPQTIVEQP